MKTRTLAILAAAILASGAATFAMREHGRPAVADHSGELVFPNLPARIDGVAKIAVERAGETFEIVRTADGAWTMPSKAGYPVDFAQVRKLALEVANLRVIEARTANKALHAEIDVDGSGKDQKGVRVMLSGPQGEEYASLLVGRARFGRQGNAGDGTFVRRANEDQVWFVQGRVSVEREPAKWLEKRIADVARERIAHASVVAGGQRLDVDRAKPDQKDFDLKPIPDGKKVKSEFDVNLVASALEGLDLEDVRKEDGLTFAPGRDYAEYTTFDGLTLRVELASEGADTWVRLRARYAAPATPAEGEKFKKPEDVAKEADDIEKRLHGWAYRLPAYKVEYLTRKIADLVEDKGA
ncbi:MAG: DUF4340 domain-containing protein [Proteobacteria bacterium]|nr:DUF4340 domain-containing protein [Pseudomonadota bacterium]